MHGAPSPAPCHALHATHAAHRMGGRPHLHGPRRIAGPRRWARERSRVHRGPDLGRPLRVHRRGRLAREPYRRRLARPHRLRLHGDPHPSRTLRLAFGTAYHHLDVLVSKRLVRRNSRSGRCRYYPSASRLASGPDDRADAGFGSDWHPRTRVFVVLVRLGEAGPSVVAKALGMSRQLASYHLNRLQELGLARKERGRYRPSPNAAREERPPASVWRARTRWRHREGGWVRPGELPGNS